MICKNCKAVISDDAKFCLNCGTQIKAENEMSSREKTLETLSQIGNANTKYEPDFSTTTASGNNIISLIMQGVGLAIAVFGLIGSIIMAADMYSGGFLIFIIGSISSCIVGLLFFAIGEIISLLNRVLLKMKSRD